MFVQTRRPASHVSGTITFVDVHPAGKGYRTEVLLQTANGQELLAYANGRSLYFRLGERVELSYHEHSGVIVQARFIGIDGREEGVFNSADSWTAGVGVLLGLLLIGTAFRMYKRDPESAEESWGSKKVPLNSVDKGSLLHLSDNHQD